MSDHGRHMHDEPKCGADAAAYALDALNEAEAAAFRRHLARCAVCHDELSAFREAVDALPGAAPQFMTPRGLRTRVMRAVRADAKDHQRPLPRQPVRRRAFEAAVPRAALAASVAVAAAATVAGGVVLSSGGSSQGRVIRASVIGSPGSARLRVAGGHAELVVNDLPPPPAGRIYEMWLQRPGHLSPTRALFSVTARGDAEVGVPGSLHGVSAVLVTEEPGGGSPTPTHAPVIVARLT